MKQLFYVVLLLITFACISKPETNTEEEKGNVENTNNIYAFKTIGLNDSIIADSIWKMIFTIEGIEQLVIQNNDSLVVVSTSGNNITRNQLKHEITSRGGVIID